MNPTKKPQQRKYSTQKNNDRLQSRRIVLPLQYEAYQIAMSTAETATATINQQMSRHPELFPAEMQAGYKLNGWTQPSQKMPEVRLRRIRLQEPNSAGQKLAYTIAPCDLLPYLTGTTEELEHALFVHQFGP